MILSLAVCGGADRSAGMSFTRDSTIGLAGAVDWPSESARSGGSSAVELLEARTVPGESGSAGGSGSASIASMLTGFSAACWAAVKGAIAPNSASVRMTERLTRGVCGITERIFFKRNTSWTSRFADAYMASESGCTLSIYLDNALFLICIGTHFGGPKLYLLYVLDLTPTIRYQESTIDKIAPNCIDHAFSSSR